MEFQKAKEVMQASLVGLAAAFEAFNALNVGMSKLDEKEAMKSDMLLRFFVDGSLNMLMPMLALNLARNAGDQRDDVFGLLSSADSPAEIFDARPDGVEMSEKYDETVRYVYEVAEMDEQDVLAVRMIDTENKSLGTAILPMARLVQLPAIAQMLDLVHVVTREQRMQRTLELLGRARTDEAKDLDPEFEIEKILESLNINNDEFLATFADRLQTVYAKIVPERLDISDEEVEEAIEAKRAAEQADEQADDGDAQGEEAKGE